MGRQYQEALAARLEPDEAAALAAIGQRVKTARMAHGLTHGRLAVRVGIVRNTMMQIEAGTSSFSVIRLLRLATALGVDAGWLLTGKGAPGAADAGLEAHPAGGDGRARHRDDPHRVPRT